MLRYVLGFVLGVLFTSLIARADTRWKSAWYEELRVTVEALFYVEKYYVDSPDLKSLVSAAIRSGLETLDPHCRYYSPDEMQALRESAAGRQRQPGFLYESPTEDSGQFLSLIHISEPTRPY